MLRELGGCTQMSRQNAGLPQPEDPTPPASLATTFQLPFCRPWKLGAGTPLGALSMEAVHDLCMSVACRSRKDSVSSLQAALVSAQGQAVPRDGTDSIAVTSAPVSLVLLHRGGYWHVR